MSSIRFAFRAHTANAIVKTVLVLAMLFCVFFFGYRHGVEYTIQNAQPSVDGEVILIDFDGQIHEYR